MAKKNLWKSYSQDEYVKLEQVNNSIQTVSEFWKNGKGMHKGYYSISAKGRVQRFAGNHKRERAVESRR